jgi:zinc transporter ZupT
MKYYFFIVALLLVTFSSIVADGHLFGGETKQVRNYNITYVSIPENPILGTDTTLAFSILSENTDIFNMLAKITIMKGDDIVAEIPETRYPTGDIFVPFTFTEDGLYRITLEAKLSEDPDPIATTFDQGIGQPATRSSTGILDVNSAIGLSIVFGVIPLYIGLTNSRLSHKLRNSLKGFITGAAFGIVIFSLIDLFGGASRLGIDFGLRAISLQSTLLFAFAIALVIPFVVERYSKIEVNTSQITTYTAAYLFALAVAFHSFAEGVVIGFDLQSGYSFTFTQQSLQATSFFLHKIAEGLVISIPIMLIRPKTETFVLAGIVGSIPLLIGITTAYLGIPGLAASYAFALGAGVSTYVLFKLGYLSNLLTQNKMLIFSGIIVGFLFMYLAGWIHSIEV